MQRHQRQHRLAFLFLLFALSLSSVAQSFEEYKAEQKSRFDRFLAAKQSDYERYRRQRNEQFADYVAKRWELFEVKKGVRRPKENKPKTPPVAPLPDDKPQEQPVVTLPKGDVITPKAPVSPQDNEIPPLPIREIPAHPKVSFSFLGSRCTVRMSKDMRFKMSGCGEKEVSKQLKMLSTDKYTPLFADCAALCKNMKLNGWATFLLCRTVAEQLQGSGNEAVLLQSFLLTQLGYDARMACRDDRTLVIICPLEMDICSYYYLLVDGKKYYILDSGYKGGSITTYRKNMRDASRVINFSAPAEMKLAYTPSPVRQHPVDRSFTAHIDISVNKNLIDYYATLPVFSGDMWAYYAQQPVDDHLKQQLFPPLKQLISGKSETEAVMAILHFMHYGFNYATDAEQFGFEKPFYLEENFYYPANDCEDRAILFVRLVRELVGIDAVLLYAPGHLWTAVAFHEDVRGDNILHKNKKYTVCDPTYIGASIGQSMPEYRTQKVAVLETQ